MQAGNITILPDPGNPANSYTQLYAANNQYAAPIKFLLSGFEAGFWGGQALSVPDAVAGNTGAAHLDLNKSWNWSGLYAYEAVGTANGAIANFDYRNTISSARVDPYAEQVFKTSNAYGWSFSDFIASLDGVTNPTLNLWTGTADADISIKLFGLTDTPTGYTPTALELHVPGTLGRHDGSEHRLQSVHHQYDGRNPRLDPERGAGRWHADAIPLLFWR